MSKFGVLDDSEYPNYRDPFPSLTERLYWLWVRFRTNYDVPPKSWVQLSCPETGRVIATEHTDPLEADKDIEHGTGVCTYDCPECGTHSFLWGPPCPVLLDQWS